MTIDPNDSRHLIADEGMIIRRISDKVPFGYEVHMGDGEVPEHFEEIRETQEEPEDEIL